MKQILSIYTLLILTGCGQPDAERKVDGNVDRTETTARVKEKPDSENVAMHNDDHHAQSLIGFKDATRYKLTDTIKADFNGDGMIDQAFYKRENQTSGIIIVHGHTNEEFKIGFGKRFAVWENFDCNWVDYWGLVRDSETTESTFTEEGDVLGSKNVKLQNPSIVIRGDESGGGVITFKNGSYIWIHQTC